MSSSRVLIVLVLLGLVLGLLASPAAFAEALRVGEPFSSLSFPVLDEDEPRSIHDFRGTKLIAHVFASW